ncbi:MAG TPA: ABC transporter ATP-binding protein [Candidatus Limnocylindria bacterium]|nr:ABC transporter ATP-binding protein [Candidatus Limnocylindria bacterium]
MIDVRDLSRSFGSTIALERVSFRVEPGEIVALLGPNGAGKTTASRIIAAILAPSAGDVLVDGISVRADPGRIRVRCGMVTDQPSLYERMTLRAYLEFFCHLYDVAGAAKRTEELAALLGLADRLDVRLGAFSRGMKQKVAIARGLVHDPPVLLLDEPATALDPETARSLRSFIVSLRARHRAILLCTHDLDEAQRIADRVVVLYRGQVARSGPTGDLRAEAHPRFVVSFTGDVAVARDTLARVGVDAEPAEAENGYAALRFDSDEPGTTNPEVLRALLASGLRVITLTREERSLEDAYFSIVAEAGERRG